MVRDYLGTFGDFIRMKRKERNMTIKDIIKLVKTSEAYYSFIEASERKAPKQEVLDRIVEILELTEDERIQLFDLAGKTRGIVATDLSDYIISNSYAREALRKARDNKVGQELWQRFIASLN